MAATMSHTFIVAHLHPNESNDARMRQSTDEDQLAKVLIQSDENSPLSHCQCEQRFI